MDPQPRRLIEVAEAVTPAWAEHLLCRLVPDPDVALRQRLSDIAAAVTASVTTGLRELFELDPEAQRTNPLTIFRQATAPISELAMGLGVPPVQRDEFARRSFPDDVYGLNPATWADIHPD
ncbi:MAG: hypothetical protein ACKPBG_04495, partial [Actinomycetota bacterium]